MRLASTLVAMTCLVAGVAAANAPPFRQRVRRGVHPNIAATSLVSPGDWPPEPVSPTEIDAARFAGAMQSLCGWMPPGRSLRYADAILHDAARFHVDPFLLGGLVHRMSHCRSDAEVLHGVGLTLIPPAMYAPYLRHGVYRYWVREADHWTERDRHLDRFPFYGPRLRRPRENLYFAAAFLSVWKEQAPSLDAAFPQVPHRSYVSHFVWGDRVESDRAEDHILTDRRRLLFYYGTVAALPPIHRLGLTLGCPLDGGPRVMSGFIGDPRDGGSRKHEGVDIEASLFEPVRAIADGVVYFAGVQLHGRHHVEELSPDHVHDVPRAQLGRGGRFVCILHRRPGQEPIRSCYMHLESTEVRRGQHVHRGDPIGTVGRTGMRVSASHLHFELHGPSGLLDPAHVMRGLLIGAPPS